MSCNYAEGLSPYENKGVLGLPEKFESPDKLEEKCELLAQMIKDSKHVVVHTGAGISTSAGIPDFRGPNGVWTLEKAGKKPEINTSFAEAKPTTTHMILKKLVDSKMVHYIVSQNIDGLHLKSGLQRSCLAELHGNMFVDECNVCKRQFIRSAPAETVGKKCSGVPCAAQYVNKRPCRGRLYDGVLDWEHSLPENDLLMSEWHCSIADLSICLGTTLQIIPSGNLPLDTLRYGGKLAICNLQPTKHDNKADLIINYYVDDILEKVMEKLNIEIPLYNEEQNPIILAKNKIIDWTISRKDVLALEKIFKAKCKGVKKKRILVKRETEVCNKMRKIDKNTKKTKSYNNGNLDTNELPKSEAKTEEQETIHDLASNCNVSDVNKDVIVKTEVENVDIINTSGDKNNGNVSHASVNENVNNENGNHSDIMKNNCENDVKGITVDTNTNVCIVGGNTKMKSEVVSIEDRCR